MTRESFIKEFRGLTLGEISSQSSEEEVFQNSTLRPILKLQNDLIIAVFQSYLNQNKIPFDDFSLDKKMKTIEVAILKDISFQNTLKGIVVGLFTINEFSLYSNNTSGFNKRIRSMLIERLQSQLQLI
ncbi:MAG: hypothetical protein RL542_262 [Bacteroidota bacterium]|jgi:hypothetical protein|uniref:glyoxalase n=1 Tax=Flavobacterium sp. TaxID=239 RepID=UPI00286F48B0|nr:glyoxalase [Flavobacterium sp.]